MEQKKKVILLLDINSMFNRVYFASKSTKNREYDAMGIDITALNGLQKMIKKLIKEFEPKFIVAAGDSMDGKYFRHELYPEYKGGRPDKEESFYQLKKRIPKMMEYMKIHYEEKHNFEADDIIASYCKLIGNNKNFITIIVSQDNDLKQLINENISCLQRKKLFGESKDIMINDTLFKEELGGLSLDNFLAVKALTGDKSDNLPGINGIGEKTAIKLLQKYGNLRNLVIESQKDNNNNNKLIIIREGLQGLSKNLKLMKLVDNLEVSDASKICYPKK